jgi:hypothetical protein
MKREKIVDLYVNNVLEEFETKSRRINIQIKGLETNSQD